MKHGFHEGCMAFIKSLIVNLAILAIWLIFEYNEFGSLQDRECDDVVFMCYFLIIWWLFAQKG